MLGDRHGDVKVSLLDNNIVYAQLTGSFNEAGAKVYTSGVKQLVVELGEQPFAILVDNSNMQGGTPNAYKELERYNEWLTQTKLVAKAIIVETQVTTELIKSLSPSVKQQNMKSFLEKDAAIDWLTSQLNWN